MFLTEGETSREVEEALNMEEDPISCAVCNTTTQHVCVLCGKKVCQIFCSEQDPNSTNEYHRKHFDEHMNNHNETSYEELTQISNASESLWRYVPCLSCGENFENELDLKIHQDNDHTEELKCQECGYKTSNRSMMENHVKDIHTKNIYQKRIKQNLFNVDFEEESDDEYHPSDNDEEIEENDNLLKKKCRKGGIMQALYATPAWACCFYVFFYIISLRGVMNFFFHA